MKLRDRGDLWLGRGAFERLVEEALDGLPAEFAELLENVAVVVEEEASRDLLAEMGMDPEEELLGVYQGVPITERDSFYQALPDRIALFRGPILRCCGSRREVIREVRDTVVHELGHYFGLGDEEMPY
ncbi:MAG TPA: metallopeptidase family protein [Thermoanaerobaculia bacterium]|nr:metallopeptidase family protein [Thermoanaerobaculia bacterium]